MASVYFQAAAEARDTDTPPGGAALSVNTSPVDGCADSDRCCRKLMVVFMVACLALAFGFSVALFRGYYYQESSCDQWTCSWAELQKYTCPIKIAFCPSDRAWYGSRCYAAYSIWASFTGPDSCYAASRAVVIATGVAFVVLCAAICALAFTPCGKIAWVRQRIR